MDTLKVHNTPTAQWHSLVTDAQVHCNKNLNEELESYLVFLLMRFVDKPEIVSSIVAEDFLNASQASGHTLHTGLRDVGDKCLIFSGLFPKLAEHRRVDISYFVDIGRSAYGSLTTLPEQYWNGPYAELEASFVILMDILQVIHSMDRNADKPSPLQALDLWEKTGSEEALKTVKEISDDAELILPSFHRQH